MSQTRIWPRPRLNPLPQQTGNLTVSQLSLNGADWKLNLEPDEYFYDPASDYSSWQDINVPMEIEAGEHEYAYSRILHIPADWQQQRIFVRFDGANCYARVFVNGVFIRDHYGGFVSWDCEITDHIVPGQDNRLVIGLTDKPHEINPFHRGGLIRDVTMYAVPETYLARLHVETVFDADYVNATLIVSAALAGGSGSLAIKLTSPSGEIIQLDPLTGEAERDMVGRYVIPNPMKWDSEHPYLYTLSAMVIVDEICQEVAEKRIGFREIERRGSEVFINGDLLKLRGINRHDIHPVTGRSITRELVEQDVLLFKQANINFIRTSHYPPRPDFLDLCDRYGIYVEDEIAVSFLGYGVWRTESDPAYTSCYMDQLAEMIERDRSHPSVIIWSLANESHWGENLAMMNAYARKEDPSRLTIFSYPLTQNEDDEPTDIWSVHYDRWDRNLTDLTDCHRRSIREPANIPVLHDESTHIPCYDRAELQRDPGVRDFWGETIYRFWDRLWETSGALGCAIWAGIDDTRENNQAWSWGIIDGWRRMKPEYWHTRKGFSPIRLLDQPQAQGDVIVLSIHNRFNHTNLSEIRVDWKLADATGECQGPNVPPRGKGVLVIPAHYRSGEQISLTFTDPFGFQVEEALYTLDERKSLLPRLTGGEPSVERTVDTLRISGKSFSITFSTKTGLIVEGYDRETLVLSGGPALNLVGLPLGPWQLDTLDAGLADRCAKVTIEGGYGKVKVRFVIRIDVEGLMETTYTVTDMPFPSPREVALTSSITSHSGGYHEAGIYFVVPRALDSLRWKRKGLWNVYPDWHIARLKGVTPKFNPQGSNLLHRRPEWDWQMDERDWTQFGTYEIGRRGTRDFTSTKPSILRASMENSGAAFTALSDGSDAVRMELDFNARNIVLDRDPAVVYRGNWASQLTKYRSLGGTETYSSAAGDDCEYTFIGTGIAWIANKDVIGGIAKVYIDGVLKDEAVDLGLSRAGKNPRGSQKLYRQLVYAIEHLPMGEHKIRIVVTGEKAPESNNSYVNIDHFIVLDGNEVGDTRFMINSEFNYPELSWGNYTKPPITVSTGFTRKVYTKLGQG